MTLEAVKDHTKSSSFQTSQYFAVFRKDNFTKFFTGKSCLPMILSLKRWYGINLRHNHGGRKKLI